MKKLLITLSTLIILTSCGYSSENECRLKEMQKCNDAATCESQAYLYCSDEFRGDSWLSILFDWIWTIGYWGLMVLAIFGWCALIASAFFSDNSKDRAESRITLLILTVVSLVIFLVLVYINS